MMNWLRSKWHARQRRIDMEILWPQLLQQMPILAARAVFFRHTKTDPAWRELSEPEILSIVDALP